MSSDDEYEEIEVEVEEEVEEEEEYEEVEVEEDDDDEEMEEEEETSVSPNVTEGVESKEHQEQGEHPSSGSFAPVVGSIGEAKSLVASDTKEEAGLPVEDCKSLNLGNHLGASDDMESVYDKKDTGASVEREAQNDIYDVGKVSIDHGCVPAEPSVINGKEAVISTKNGSMEEADVDMDVEACTEEVREQSIGQTRFRSLSPATDLSPVNKKPAVVCDFFAKGWCIKGSSCKFLHVKDHTEPEVSGNKSELQSEIGLAKSSERPEVVGSPVATISPVTLRRSQSQELGEGHFLNKNHEIFPHQPGSSSHGISPNFLHSDAHEESSRSNLSMREFGGGGLKLNPVEECSINRSQNFLNTYSTSSFPAPTSGDLPSFSASRARFLVGSFGKDPSDTIGSSSLLRSSSTFSGSESKSFPLKDFSMDPIPVAGHRAKISSDDWEPSVPFRPSFPYTKNLLAPLLLYDPLRDSIEQSKAADRLEKFLSTPEKTITPAGQSTDNNPVLQKTNQPECGSDNYSITGHSKLHNLSEEHLHNKYSLPTEGETMGTYNDLKNSGSNSPKEENVLRDVLGKDQAETEEGILDSSPAPQKNGMTLRKEIEMGKDRRKNELNLDSGRDGGQRESKEMKIFRIALIDFIKEIVRPAWGAGRVSKDAHKMVVKRAVEKVLSTVQPHQAPNTEESIQHYLSISKPKITKLVEAYVVRYENS